MIGVDYGSYSFDAASSQITINLPNGTPKLESILLITNVIDNIIIYNFADPTLGGTLLGNILTLTYSTVAMSNTDKLQIWYYNEQPQAVDIQDLALSIRRDLQMIRREPNMTPLGLNINVNGGTLPTVTTVNTVTTVSTVSQLSYLGGSSEGAYTLLTNKALLNEPWYSYKNKIIT